MKNYVLYATYNVYYGWLPIREKVHGFFTTEQEAQKHFHLIIKAHEKAAAETIEKIKQTRHFFSNHRNICVLDGLSWLAIIEVAMNQFFEKQDGEFPPKLFPGVILKCKKANPNFAKQIGTEQNWQFAPEAEKYFLQTKTRA